MRASMHGEVADTRSKEKRQCLHTGYVHSRIVMISMLLVRCRASFGASLSSHE